MVVTDYQRIGVFRIRVQVTLSPIIWNMAAFNDFLMLSPLNRYVTRIVCVSMLYALPVSKEDYGRTKREKASCVGFLVCSNMFIFAGKYKTFEDFRVVNFGAIMRSLYE